MKRLDRYIGRTVLTSTILTLLVLLVLMGFFELMNELDDVGKGNYRVRDVLLYVLLVLPRMAYEIFPVVMLLGSLIGLGALANSSELIAMRASGVSLRRIIFSVLRTGLVGIVCVILIGELLAPYTEQHAERMKMERVSKQITLKSRYGFWARDKNRFINVRQILPGSQLRNINIYEFDDDAKLTRSTYIARASYIDGRWELTGVRSTLLSDTEIRSKHSKKEIWDSLLSPRILDVVAVKPSMLPVWDLSAYIDFLQENGQDTSVYRVAYWGKVLMPVTTLIMVFLSVPFVFGVLRSVAIGQRIFVGALVGLGFFMLNRVAGHMAVVYLLNPALMISIPVVLFFILGLWYTRRIA